MKSIEMSVAYPVWIETTIVTVSILGISLFYESMSFIKGFSIFFLVIGLVGLTVVD